ncbi:MAG: RidA family protein [Rhodospirillaceae bacterium]|jgi:2-iminobutanoate/2-iminopropanoate deaminase|nr:RidA family protein [Rhodospirillaceae bacterium]
MSKQRIYSDAAGEPPEGTWSNCLVVDKHVYIAGMTSRSDEFNTIVGDNAYEQSKVIFDKIKALIEAAGGTMADIVKVNIFLADINDRQQVWEARREYFEGDFPVSTLLEISKLVHPDMLVEIEAVGMLGAG